MAWAFESKAVKYDGKDIVQKNKVACGLIRDINSYHIHLCLLAPHTSGPKDVPRCGVLSFSKDATLQGGSSRNRFWAERKIVGFGDWCLVPGGKLPLFWNSRARGNFKFR
jgi:hypothetical protein